MEWELYFKFVIRVAMSFCDWKLLCDIKVFYTIDQIGKNTIVTVKSLIWVKP